MDCRAALSVVASEAAFEPNTNDLVSWNQCTINVGEPNPMLVTNSLGGIHVSVAQPATTAM